MFQKDLAPHEHQDQAAGQLRPRNLPREPTMAPALIPTAESRKVVRPIRPTARRMSTWRKAKVMPTVRASMLVATASGSMARGAKEVPRLSSSWLRDSRIMFRPMRPKSRKAIQWSILEIRLWNRLPSSQPKKGISPWKPPNHSPAVSAWLRVTRPADSPLHTDTAKASIDRPTAKRNNSIILMSVF